MFSLSIEFELEIMVCLVNSQIIVSCKIVVEFICSNMLVIIYKSSFVFNVFDLFTCCRKPLRSVPCSFLPFITIHFVLINNTVGFNLDRRSA